MATVEAIEAIRPIILGPQSKSRDNSISRLFSRVLQARNTTISKRKERGGDKVNPWDERGVDRLLVQRGSNPGGDQPIFTRWRDLTNLLRIGDHGGGGGYGSNEGIYTYIGYDGGDGGYSGRDSYGDFGGDGGTQSAGGAGGIGFYDGPTGTLGVGGNGGGGAYFGGGGGGGGGYPCGNNCNGGGAGGSSYSAGIDTTYTDGYQSGNGQIIITY